MSERWSAEDVWALTPDASSKSAALKVAKPTSWPATGWHAGPDGAVALVWGECEGSGKQPYQAAVDLAGANGPASRCSCPSRKFPCKHALAVLYLWSTGEVNESTDLPDWVEEWLDKRAAARQARAERATASHTASRDPQSARQAERTAREREELVASGVTELELWLTDQVEAGLAEAPRREKGHWERMGQRLVDAKAGGLASRVNALASLVATPNWPDRLLEELALLRLLVTGYRRGAELPERTRAAVRERVGFTVRTEDLLATGERVRDIWQVLTRHDLEPGPDKVAPRRVWLRGTGTGRVAMALSFAVPGQAADARLRVGTAVDADLVFYPSGLRAVLAEKHAERTAPPSTGTAAEALRDYAEALATDPWLDAWPVVIADARVAREPAAEQVARAGETSGRSMDGNGWALLDTTGAALPLRRGGADPWKLIAVGGNGATVAGEWTPRGLYPLTVWGADGHAVVL